MKKKHFYKEFKVMKVLVAITKVGIHIITDKGNFGFKIDRIGFEIRTGFVTKCYNF